MKMISWVYLHVLLVVLFLSGASLGWAQSTTGDGKVFEFKMGTTQAMDNTTTIGANKMADLVKEKTGGRVKITVYPAMQLGDPKTQAEGLRMGTLDSAWVASAALAPFIPDMGAISFPYLFKDRTHVGKALNGKAGEMLGMAAEKIGIKVLAWGENGYRQITNSKRPVVKPADLNGVKLRVYPIDIYISTFENLGAIVVPMSLSELYMAMQTGAVDGQENAVDLVTSYKFYEVQKYLTMSNHIYGDWAIAFNLRKWNTLPKDLQEIVTQCAKETAVFQIKLATDTENEKIALLKQKNVRIDPISGYDEWRLKVKPVYDKFGAKYKDLLKAIDDVK
jgi:tripartite ATP-independent transporter DctP family solute receptor